MEMQDYSRIGMSGYGDDNLFWYASCYSNCIEGWSRNEVTLIARVISVSRRLIHSKNH